jgi:hypothetical protein
MSVVSTYPIRHDYGYIRGVQFFCTPPLCSRGVQKFMYATEDNSSYSYFPSSAAPSPLLLAASTAASCALSPTISSEHRCTMCPLSCCLNSPSPAEPHHAPSPASSPASPLSCSAAPSPGRQVRPRPYGYPLGLANLAGCGFGGNLYPPTGMGSSDGAREGQGAGMEVSNPAPNPPGTIQASVLESLSLHVPFLRPPSHHTTLNTYRWERGRRQAKDSPLRPFDQCLEMCMLAIWLRS